ncbi:MAG TPA: mechanosensitive ion channel family protein, partial [Acetobacteraceae bacterium]|nr:mechanosensitive ion channel family protein [Acetobacteraceae bacterium]
SARNSGEAWDLRCLVREGLIAFLQENYPGALPKQRVEIEGQSMPEEAMRGIGEAQHAGTMASG